LRDGGFRPTVAAMVRPRVWAPDAGRVAVVVDGVEHPAERSSDGWWQCPVELPGGTEYWLQRDDGPLRSDPRALAMPQGLEGPAQVFDPRTLAWTDDRFRPVPWDDAVIYELHLGTFTAAGTLDAALERLDDLAALGVTHVELMPINVFAGNRGWGYDGVFLFATHPAYGGPAALARFVDAAHARGLGVLLDVVYNHVGPGSERLSAWAPYYAPQHETPWGPTFDFTRAEVRRFVCDNALMWLRDFHFDGLRLDAVQTIVDPSDEHILAQLGREVAELSEQTGRRYDIVAETILNERHMVEPLDSGGFGLRAHWHEDFHHALQSVLTGETAGYYEDFGTLGQLAHVLRHGYLFDGSRPNRWHGTSFGEPAEGLHGNQLVAYLQTHDQVGNRADGARITDLVGHRDAMIGTALTLLGPCVPMLWQGEEWGASRGFHFFCDHPEPLTTAVREGRRSELRTFGFDVAGMLDPGSAETMAACVLDWDERSSQPHADTVAWTRALLAFRREHGLGAGPLAEVEVEFDEDAGWLAMRRRGVEIVANFGTDEVRVSTGSKRLELHSLEGVQLDGGQLTLPGRSVAVLV
jgi:maltooligosyltrehalose trehalohydrolase